MSLPAVRVQDLSYTFAGRAEPTLRDIGFELPDGSWTLVAGCTGSGKSTLLRALCGLIPHHTAGTMQGTVTLFGRDTRDTPLAALAGTVGLVLQSPDDQICTTTVLAEVAFGLENLALSIEQIGPRIDASLRQFGLTDYAQARSHQLSGGQKQRLLLAAIMAMQPRLLLLDEPFSQLDSQAAAELLKELDRLRANGLTIVVVEHRLDELLPRADRVLLLADGKLLAQAATNDATALSAGFDAAGLRLPEVARLSLALGQSTLTRSVSEENLSSPRLRFGLVSVEGLCYRFPDSQRPIWSEVAFQLHIGDRVALLGPNGAGKSTLLAILAGLYRATSGRVVVDPDNDPLLRGLLLQQPDLMLFCRTVREELAFGPRQLGVPREEVDDRVTAVAKLLSIADLIDQPPQALSQGERLRTALAATLTMQPRLLLLDEPTTGQDQRNVDEIMGLIMSVDCVIFATHDLRAACRHANRVLVLGNGRLLADCRPAELLSDDALLAAAGLRRTPLFELRQQLGLQGLTVDDLIAELQP